MVLKEEKIQYNVPLNGNKTLINRTFGYLKRRPAFYWELK